VLGKLFTDQGQHRLAEGTSLGVLSETPLRIQPGLGQNNQKRLTAIDFIIKTPFPILTDTQILRIQKDVGLTPLT
jgi:hypothetical protein